MLPRNNSTGVMSPKYDCRRIHLCGLCAFSCAGSCFVPPKRNCYHIRVCRGLRQTGCRHKPFEIVLCVARAGDFRSNTFPFPEHKLSSRSRHFRVCLLFHLLPEQQGGLCTHGPGLSSSWQWKCRARLQKRRTIFATSICRQAKRCTRWKTHKPIRPNVRRTSHPFRLRTQACIAYLSPEEM